MKSTRKITYVASGAIALALTVPLFPVAAATSATTVGSASATVGSALGTYTHSTSANTDASASVGATHTGSGSAAVSGQTSGSAQTGAAGTNSANSGATGTGSLTGSAGTMQHENSKNSLGAEAMGTLDSALTLSRADLSGDTSASGSANGDVKDMNASGSATADARGAVQHMDWSGVSSRDQLSTYARSLMGSDEYLENVSFAGDAMAMDYNAPARFLGLFPATLTTHVQVASDGTVETKYPWYHFFYAMDKGMNGKWESTKAHVKAILAENGNHDSNGRLTAHASAEILAALLASFTDGSTDMNASGNTMTNGTASSTMNNSGNTGTTSSNNL